jgi:hypothetical protein
MQVCYVIHPQQRKSTFKHDNNSSLNINENTVVWDFSENDSLILQDTVQSIQWNNSYATVHPSAISRMQKMLWATLATWLTSDCLVIHHFYQWHYSL